MRNILLFLEKVPKSGSFSGLMYQNLAEKKENNILLDCETQLQLLKQLGNPKSKIF